jgi:hypothetical protein
METMTAAHLLREYLKEEVPHRITGGAGSDRLLIQVAPFCYRTNIVVQVEGNILSVGLWSVSKRADVKEWVNKWVKRIVKTTWYDIHDPHSFPCIRDRVMEIMADYERAGLNS